MTHTTSSIATPSSPGLLGGMRNIVPYVFYFELIRGGSFNEICSALERLFAEHNAPDGWKVLVLDVLDNDPELVQVASDTWVYRPLIGHRTHKEEMEDARENED